MDLDTGSAIITIFVSFCLFGIGSVCITAAICMIKDTFFDASKNLEEK